MSKGEVKVKGIRLRAFRKLADPTGSGRRGMTQAELAERARSFGGNVSESLVALIETKRRQPSRANAEALAKALGIDFEALVDLPGGDATEDTAA